MIRNSIPSIFTVGNLFLGIIAIILAFNSGTDNKNAELAAIFVIVAMLLDGLDGRVARALNAQSEFGKELDSLSDVISFGVAPAFIMYVVAFQSMDASALAWIVTAIFPICGALRLARFNVIAGTPGYFIGLPIPAAGSVLSTLALFHNEIPSAILLASTLVLSFLMVSTVKYPNFKKVGIPKTAIWLTPIIVAGAVTLAIIYPGLLSKLIFIPLVIYALYGLNGLKKNARRLFRRRKRRNSADEPTKSKTHG
ncbi:CDP-diacylglycerol--serine O-phosphatidyltransferase [Paenibacillus hemerocallicola]|jgi:CDP-diacylglycerol--serine O-phosphatidyltransferase|uniref:CDP-diacylglycerol--serine O-phosphatidyltransferase n=1 Tax=Paenibacillus hemerocallicola TaxID=1172614 RepID=A0A5C4SZE0_9BACL|nr:CDP-diacylglycerol--serine O-phosphatidyltransferase [Paenibacillus hemerocallicola]TNJ62151.1 CDP-diacylglycerol--serine O-phosphatidyltransferase [Paenibacillus hemerocallicola]